MLKKRLTIQKLHHQIGNRRNVYHGDTKVGYVNDIRMTESARSFGFTLEANQQFPVAHELRSDDLNGNGALGAGVDGLIHAAHAAFAEQLFDQILIVERSPYERVHAKLSGYSNETNCPCSGPH